LEVNKEENLIGFTGPNGAEKTNLFLHDRRFDQTKWEVTFFWIKWKLPGLSHVKRRKMDVDYLAQERPLYLGNLSIGKNY